MSKAYFTNRHGKKLAVDLDNKQENLPTVPQPTVPDDTHYITALPPTAKKCRRLRLSLTHKRRWGIVGGAVVLLLIIAAGIVVIFADGARREYDRQASAIQNLVRTAATTPSSTEISASAAIEGVLKQLESSDTCQVSQPRQLIDLYPPAREAATRCQRVFADHVAVKESVRSMQQTVVYLEQQNKALAPALARPADDAFAQIDVMQAAWGETLKTLEGMQAPSVAQAQHEALLERVRQISEQWTALTTANGAQQREAFVAAETALTTAYESLRTSQEGFRQLLDEQQAAINEAVARFAP